MAACTSEEFITPSVRETGVNGSGEPTTTMYKPIDQLNGDQASNILTPLFSFSLALISLVARMDYFTVCSEKRYS